MDGEQISAQDTDVDAEREAAKLQVLLDGLRVQLVTTSQQTTPELALSVLDDHFCRASDPVHHTAGIHRDCRNVML